MTIQEMIPDKNAMYVALVNKDSQFDGIFFAGIRTTGIFCRPTCRARKPKPENVEYFASARDALANGYRPCRVCNPLGMQGELPAWLKPVMKSVEGGCARISDGDLRRQGVDPSRLRRWFKKNHGMTFQAYLRAVRIGGAFRKIKLGDKVIEAAFGSGYDSLSGFTDAFKKAMNSSPKMSRGSQAIHLTRLLTPLGPMLAGATDEGICLLEFADRRMLETQLLRLKRLLNAVYVHGSTEHTEVLDRQLKEYFAGNRKEFDIPLVTPGTPFQKDVWSYLSSIPYGGTVSYGEQAKSMGNAGWTRAAAKANGDNRIAIVIPCHRVIGGNGKLCGYGGGLHRKRYLLDLESGRLRR